MLNEAYTFSLKLAGKVFQISALHPMSARFRNYVTADKAEYCIEITPQDIEFERKRSAREKEIEGLGPVDFDERYLETLAIYRKIAELLPKEDILLFHGSVIAVDGAGYLFTAKSGTGKSTHTRLWREMLGERAVMVDDDKPLLRVTASGVIACGTPWNGKHKLGRNMEVPLKAICVLERDAVNHIEKVSYSEIYPILLQQSYRPADPAAMICVMQLLDQIKNHVSFYRLGCNMDPSAAQVAYEGMNERNA